MIHKRRLPTWLGAYVLIGLSILAQPAHSTALYLTWGDCALGGAATSNLASGCGSSSGEQVLYAAFSVDSPIDSVLGLELIVDLQTAGSDLPDWWRLGAGECRDNGLR